MFTELHVMLERVTDPESFLEFVKVLASDRRASAANERALPMPEGYPNIYAGGVDVPGDFRDTGPTGYSPSPFVPVTVGSESSWEPKPHAGNYLAGPQPASTVSQTTKKVLGKIKAGNAVGPFGKKLTALG